MDDNWFELPASGDLRSPGVYQWWIDGVPIYTGRAIDPQRRLRQYVANVRRLGHDRAYRKSNPGGYRRVHYRLDCGIRAGARIEFRVVENCAADALNTRERHHHRQMITAAPVADLHARFAAEAKIVHAISAEQEPPEDAIRVWLRGGAVFWNQDHLEICWGLHLRQAVTQEEIDSHGIRLAIEEADDLFRSRFGSIPVRDLHGNQALAVTAWNGFFGDKLFGFFRDIHHFRVAADADSWLLAKEQDMSDALADRTGDELLSLWRNEVSL